MSFPGLAFGRKEGAILRRVQEDLRIVRDAERELAPLVAAVARGDGEASIARRGLIFELESKAATARREVSAQIAEGAFFGGIREDMIILTDTIWKIADKTKDAARLLTLAEIADPHAREILASEDSRQFLANLDLAVEALQHLVETFAVDRRGALERVRAVERCEEAADAYKQNVLAALFERSRGIDPVTMILVRDFVFCADDVADNADRASDLVLVLIAKGYG